MVRNSEQRGCQTFLHIHSGDNEDAIMKVCLTKMSIAYCAVTVIPHFLLYPSTAGSVPCPQALAGALTVIATACPPAVPLQSQAVGERRALKTLISPVT